jgi:uncharacterized protein YjbJ (UPF0337 family)
MADETIDKATGRLKEAGGALAGDSKLKDEGRAEQAEGSVKKAVDNVADAVTGKHKGG